MPGIRRDTNNRLTLFRTCHTCGQTIITTADTPFLRQIRFPDGHKKNCYFCSSECKWSSYKHIFDGLADVRKQEKRREYRSSEKYRMEERERWKRRKDAVNAKKRERYAQTYPVEKEQINAYKRKLYALKKSEEQENGKM